MVDQTFCPDALRGSAGDPCPRCGNGPCARTSNLRSIHAELITLAAEFARGTAVPDWSNHKWYSSTPHSERREILKTLRDIEETMRLYAIRLRDIADKVPAEMKPSETSAPRALAFGDEVTYAPLYDSKLPREGWKVEVLPKLTYMIKHPNGSLIAVDAGEINAVEPSAPQDESGWLIELAMKGVPHWLMVSSVREWTPDAIKAVRFAREEDAEAMLFFLGIEDSKATEHAWVATSPRECGPPADHCEKHGPHRAFAGGCPGCYHEKHDLPRAQEKATAPRTIFEADVAPGGWAYPSTGPSPCQGIAKDGRDCALTMQHEGECSPENGT